MCLISVQAHCEENLPSNKIRSYEQTVLIKYSEKQRKNPETTEKHFSVHTKMNIQYKKIWHDKHEWLIVNVCVETDTNIHMPSMQFLLFYFFTERCSNHVSIAL